MTNVERALVERIEELSETINTDHSILPYGSDDLWDLIRKKHEANVEIHRLLGTPRFLNVGLALDSPVCRYQSCWMLPNGEALIVGNELDEGWQRCIRHPATFLEQIEREATVRGKTVRGKYSAWSGLKQGQFYAGGWFLPN